MSTSPADPICPQEQLILLSQGEHGVDSQRPPVAVRAYLPRLPRKASMDKNGFNNWALSKMATPPFFFGQLESTFVHKL